MGHVRSHGLAAMGAAQSAPSPLVCVGNTTAHRPECWMASCRREVALDSFSPELIVFQPNMVPCCPEGYQCKRMHDLEHIAAYQHPPPYHGESTIMGGSEHPEDQYEDQLATLRHTG